MELLCKHKVLEECVGKTIKHVLLGDITALLVFDDGTFAQLQAQVAWEDPELIEGEQLDFLEFSVEQCLDIGLIDQAFIDAKRRREEQRKEDARKAKRERDEREFERLKRELGK